MVSRKPLRVGGGAPAFMKSHQTHSLSIEAHVCDSGRCSLTVSDLGQVQRITEHIVAHQWQFALLEKPQDATKAQSQLYIGDALPVEASASKQQHLHLPNLFVSPLHPVCAWLSLSSL